MIGAKQNSLKRSILFLICGLIYAAYYDFLYRNYTNVWWSYMGAEYTPMSDDAYSSYLIAATIPMFFFRGISSIASAISFFTYILVYIPTLLAIQVTYSIGQADAPVLFIELFLFQICMFTTDNMMLMSGFITNTRKRLDFKYLEYITIILLGILLLTNASELRFVNFLSDSDLMYELRAQHSEARAPWSGYILRWLKGAFLPILLIVSLRRKSIPRICMIVMAYVLIYMLDMEKNTLLMPFVMILLYYMILRHSKINIFFPITVIFLFIIVSYLLYRNLSNPAIIGIAAIFIMRTQCVAGWLSTLYFDFFTHPDHPFTYYTHINIVNFITNSYPYDDVLGYAVGAGKMNANANYLLTDGYAAAGTFGVPIAAVLMIITKSILNGINTKYRPNLCMIAFLPPIIDLMNVSLLTAILTCGFLVQYLIFANFDLKELEY